MWLISVKCLYSPRFSHLYMGHIIPTKGVPSKSEYCSKKPLSIYPVILNTTVLERNIWFKIVYNYSDFIKIPWYVTAHLFTTVSVSGQLCFGKGLNQMNHWLCREA